MSLLGAAILVAVVLGAGLGQGRSHMDASTPDSAAAPSKPAPPLGHVSWIVSGADLTSLRAGNAGLARRFFDNGETFVVGSAAAQDLVPAGYRSIPTLSYTSLRAFQHDVHLGRIDPRIAAIIYDPEGWSKTPASEREAPMAAMHRFVSLASRWGYGPIVAPGRDLALEASSGCAKRKGEFLDQAYFRCDLTEGANGAENFVVQAAPEELSLDRLHGLLKGAREQLRTASPGLLTLASLSTEPPGVSREVWPIDLVRAARLELKHFPGLMLNFTPATTDLAASFLRDLEREGPINDLLVSRRD